jgi:hypothetical protein
MHQQHPVLGRFGKPAATVTEFPPTFYSIFTLHERSASRGVDTAYRPVTPGSARYERGLFPLEDAGAAKIRGRHSKTVLRTPRLFQMLNRLRQSEFDALHITRLQCSICRYLDTMHDGRQYLAALGQMMCVKRGAAHANKHTKNTFFLVRDPDSERTSAGNGARRVYRPIPDGRGEGRDTWNTLRCRMGLSPALLI